MVISKKVTYLVSIFIVTPTEQHARIRDIVMKISGGDYEFVHLHRMGVFLILNTSRDAKQLASAFAEAIASDDRILVCELGDDYHTVGLSKASYWLQNHLVTATQAPTTKKGNPFIEL
ncbi:hypothetical protein [Paraburkholderia pallida]|uniref:hypothetical protein n=1 Tax=Paraburkholderia pallida TaxID=2547399 RepID=UPI001E2F0AAA|nr:hypothetical protein [Paraburkholderia pallida]